MQVELTLPITMEGLSGFGSGPALPGKGQPAVTTRPARATEIASHEETQQALGELSRALEPFKIALKFSKDQETGTIVVEMIDQKSGETLQQIPNEASLQVAACLSKWQGRILNRRA